LQPFVQSWLQGCNNVEPPNRRQRAVTPQLLREMFTQARRGTEPCGDSRDAVISEIEVAAYFYAMIVRDHGNCSIRMYKDHPSLRIGHQGLVASRDSGLVAPIRRGTLRHGNI
jgi:hypothetical protein